MPVFAPDFGTKANLDPELFMKLATQTLKKFLTFFDLPTRELKLTTQGIGIRARCRIEARWSL